MRTFMSDRLSPEVLVGAQLAAGDLHEVHLVGTVDEVQRARVGVHVGERPVVAHTRAAEHLDRPVDDRGRQARRHDLDRGDLEAGALHADGVHQPRGLHREQAGLLDLDAALGDLLLHDRVVGEVRFRTRPASAPART